MELEGVTFFEALKTIAERNGIPMPTRAEYSDPETKQRAALLKMHEIAAQLFQSNLNSSMGAHARQYLEQRGLAAEHFAPFAPVLSSDPSTQLTTKPNHQAFSAQ